MKIEKVSANIRYSQDTGKGAWKVVELGAEGSVDAREEWQAAQAFLYAELGKQMKTLWANGSSTGAVVHGPDGAETATEPPAEPELNQTPRLHWCTLHQVMFKRRQKSRTVWYSHKAPDGSWCNEEAKE